MLSLFRLSALKSETDYGDRRSPVRTVSRPEVARFPVSFGALLVKEPN